MQLGYFLDQKSTGFKLLTSFVYVFSCVGLLCDVVFLLQQKRVLDSEFKI